MMLTQLFFPYLPGLRVTSAYRDGPRVHLEAVVTRRTATCPVCQHRSRRVHSRYRRTLADLPCAGDPVTVHLTSRRFVCRRPSCPRHIFTERLPQLMPPFARKTTRLLSQLQQDGVALGGNPGARRAQAEGKPVSARTLLRLIRALPLPPVGVLPVVGIDDWAKRRGRSYGTIVVDLVQHRVVDLLPDRTAATLATWLADHPEIQIAARDRAGAYADGLRRGCPTAIQVADRFHIGANLVAAVERVLHRYRRALRQTADQILGEEQAGHLAINPRPTSLPDASPEQAPHALTSDPQGSRARRERRRTRDAQVLALQHQGLSLSAIAQHMHLTRQTVRTVLRAGDEGVRLGRSLPPSTLRPFEPYLWQQWRQGARNARVLYEEISAQGYRGSEITLRRALRTWRTRSGNWDRTPGSTGVTATAGPPPPILRLVTPRQAAWLLVGDQAQQSDMDQAFVAHLLAAEPGLTELRDLACAFRELLRHREANALPVWLKAATASAFVELHGFAGGVRRDLAAVTAALTSEWSNGQTEGQVNRLKMLKRSMFGRSKDDLLRLRLVHASRPPRRIKSA